MQTADSEWMVLRFLDNDRCPGCNRELESHKDRKTYRTSKGYLLHTVRCQVPLEKAEALCAHHVEFYIPHFHRYVAGDFFGGIYIPNEILRDSPDDKCPSCEHAWRQHETGSYITEDIIFGDQWSMMCSAKPATPEK